MTDVRLVGLLPEMLAERETYLALVHELAARPLSPPRSAGGSPEMSFVEEEGEEEEEKDESPGSAFEHGRAQLTVWPRGRETSRRRTSSEMTVSEDEAEDGAEDLDKDGISCSCSLSRSTRRPCS